jgi:hypothetical protein
LACVSRTEIFDDFAGGVFLDFRVPRDRPRFSGGWLAIPIVLAAVPDKLTTHGLELLNQISKLHATPNSPVCLSGTPATPSSMS